MIKMFDFLILCKQNFKIYNTPWGSKNISRTRIKLKKKNMKEFAGSEQKNNLSFLEIRLKRVIQVK